MLDDYRTHAAERATLGIPPRPLSRLQVEELVAALPGEPSPDVQHEYLHLLADRVAPGVGEAAAVKAAFLAEVAGGRTRCPALPPVDAVKMLGTMQGGYCVAPLVELLDDRALAPTAASELSGTVLVQDAFDDVVAKAAAGNHHARAVLQAWAEGGWLARRPAVPDELHLTVYKVDGETNTDDLSPATEAWSRADIPLHARSLLEQRVGAGVAAAAIGELERRGRPVAFVGDVVGTGSSRKSAANSLLWHIGVDIPYVPNKRRGGVVVGGRIAPIFLDTLLDSGALAVECGAEGAAAMKTGDHIVVRPATGRIETPGGRLITAFRLRDDSVLDGVRAGGRIPLIVGRRLASRAQTALGSTWSSSPTRSVSPSGALKPRSEGGGPFTLAQKIVGRACGVAGVHPGQYCEPEISTVGSQDTAGPMNKSELEDLACLRFGADLVLQTFCHTAAYPKPADVETQNVLPPFMGSRGAVVLRPGDGIIHSWLNRMILPDQVGTGSDSHTRFPLGISFPAGSGLVAFAAAFGAMPLTMPESVLVRFRGRRRPGITVRDVVNAVPYFAARAGLLVRQGGGDGAAGRRNAFSGRIIEVEGLEDAGVDEAFELADSTAERSAAACSFNLSEESVARHLEASVEALQGLVAAGYEGATSLERRIEAMRRWLESPSLLRADDGATYAEVLEIDLDDITEPLLACPNDPDDVRPLSEVAGRLVDEVFLGSCMTSLEHFRSAARILGRAGERVPGTFWIAPPTSDVRDQLRGDGVYSVYGRAGARTEIPGCSLCMGNQARVRDGATVVSTSTRNFPNRMGRRALVYLASAEVATLAAVHGRLPTVDEYRDAVTAGGGGVPAAEAAG